MQPRVVFKFCLCLSLLLILATGGAVAADWRISQMSGDVSVKAGAVKLASLSAGGTLKAGAVVVTGANGRVLLVRGQQTMIVSPGSAVSLPADASGFTRILERTGTIEYDVDHKAVQHFAVQTPYLAAVVKGTRFQVKVYKGGASVSVIRGRVEVMDLKTGQRVDVLPGQRAVVTAGQGLAIYGAGKIQPIRQGNVRSLLNSTGLIHADASNLNASVGGLASASLGTNGVNASVGGGSIASVNAGGGSIGASVGGGAVSANVGGGGVSVNVGGISLGIH
jgi:hypothetical protein